MAVSRNVSIGASGGSSSDATVAIPMDRYQVPFNAAFGVYASGAGEATVQVQHTFNDVIRGETAHWFSHEDVSAATVVSANTNTVDGNYAFPVKAVRGLVVSASGDSTVHFAVDQAGP